MPRRPPKPCAQPGCGKLTQAGNRCELHAAEQQARRAEYQSKTNARRSESDKFYDTSRWRGLSRRYRQMHPLCGECEKHGMTVSAQLVDHIVPRKLDPSRSLDWTNLRSLCRPCHNRIGERTDRHDHG